MKIVKTYGKSLLLAAMALGIGSAAFAGGDPISATATATQELFSSDADDIQSVTDWNGVFDEEKWLAGSNFHTGSLDLGAGLNFGGLVVAPWYRGSILKADSTNSNTKDITALTSGSTYKNGEEVTTGDLTTFTENLNSNFAILVGLPLGDNALGIKLGYSNAGTGTHKGTYNKESAATSSVTTVTGIDGTEVSKDGTLYDDDGEWGTTVHKPYLQLGANLALSDTMTLKPEIDFAFTMTDTYIRTGFSTVKYPNYNQTTSRTEYDSSSKTNLLNPEVKVALELGNAEDGLKHTFNVGWKGTFALYNDDDAGANSYSSKTLYYSYTRSTSSSGHTEYADHAYSLNKFELGYKIETGSAGKDDEAGSILLAGNVNLGFSMKHDLTKSRYVSNSTSRNVYGDGTEYVSNTTTYDDSYEYEETENVFTPTLKGGVQYKITDKVRFNGGVTLALPVLTISEEKNTDYADGYETTKTTDRDGTITESTTNNGTTSISGNSDKKTAKWSEAKTESVNIGFTYFMSDNFTLDTAVTWNLNGSYAGTDLTVGAVLKY